MAHRLIWLAAACVYALAATNAAAAEQGHRYFVPSMNYIDDDGDRQIDDQLGGLQFGYGQAVAPYWDFEITGFMAGWNGFDESNQYGVALDSHLLVNTDRGAAFSPYLVFGTGLMKTIKTIAPDDSGAILALGAGADLAVRPGVALRADARWRRDFSGSTNLDDLLLSIGFRVALGEPAKSRSADSDGDGVGDDADNCPNTPVGIAVDSAGCEFDRDRDGVVDRLDKCPDTKRGASVDARGCEIVRDGDGDGVADGRDRCPNSPAGARVDANGCDFDTDADGVVDRLDRCPDTKAGTRVDARGCPLQQDIHLEGVLFESNSAQLTSSSVQRLNQAVETLKLNADLEVEVAGYTDSSGADSYNQQLSQRRAEAVRGYLVSKGIDAGRLSARGYGESQPIASNNTSEGRAQNRRVVLRVLNKKM